MSMEQPRKFKSSDGYTFYEVDGRWVDSLDPDSVDMTFEASSITGLPVDDMGEDVEGAIV